MLANLTPTERRDLIMSVGVHRQSRRLSPWQVSQLISKAQQELTLREIARDVNLRDDSVLRKFISLQKLPPGIQSLVGWRLTPASISFSVAAEISRLDTHEEMEHLAAVVVENRLSKEETQSIIQRRRRGNVPLAQAIDDVLKVRPIIEKQHLYLGLLTTDVDEGLARRNIRRRLADLVGASNVLAVKCQNRRFSVVMTSEGAATESIRRFLTPEHVQEYINSLATE